MFVNNIDYLPLEEQFRIAASYMGQTLWKRTCPEWENSWNGCTTV